MILSNLNVIYAQPEPNIVVVKGWHGSRIVVAFIPVRHLEDYFQRERHLSGQQANLLVDRNLATFARVISAKYERGEYWLYSRCGSTLPRVDVALEDITNCGEAMTDSVLDLAHVWA